MAHGEDGLRNAQETSQQLFSSQNPKQLAAEEWDKPLSGVPELRIDIANLDRGESLLGLLCQSGLSQSRSEAKRLIGGGGVKVNGVRVNDPTRNLSRDDLIGNTCLVQVGKHKHAVIRCNSAAMAAILPPS
uniref:RNA-binding S4 domain-containing protein n=2 Tax=Spongospora subterranea TaxID=70186 RepID=A0A0H5QLD9_9EUKA|eukprot:CRZ02808.1 hypothetical protein [Spongospora subterranea]